MTIQDLLAAIGVVINGLPQGLLALTFGFASVPTAAGFIAGAIGCGIFGIIAPISFQAETITLVGTMGRNIQERLSMVFWEGSILLIVGLLGIFTKIVDLIGPVITNGMMAGVGDPVFEKLDANLAKAIMSIGAVKGFEIGDGFAAADSTGSTNNDSFTIKDGKVVKIGRAHV